MRAVHQRHRGVGAVRVPDDEVLLAWLERLRRNVVHERHADGSEEARQASGGEQRQPSRPPGRGLAAHA
eukprot:7114099-Prymnesium_polylepis.1